MQVTFDVKGTKFAGLAEIRAASGLAQLAVAASALDCDEHVTKPQSRPF